MTLHTRVITTSPGIEIRPAFDKMRELLGATDEHTFKVEPSGHHWMNLGQGLPAWMWIEGDPNNITPAEECDEWCEPDCDYVHQPAHYIEIHFDTAYGYTETNGAGCGDLHAWIKREIGAWISSHGAEWRWYDESGNGWDVERDEYGSLGDPEVGRPGSTVPAAKREPRRDFMKVAFAAIALDQAKGEGPS